MAPGKKPKREKPKKDIQEKLFKKGAIAEPIIDSNTLKKIRGASISLVSKDLRVIWANQYLEDIYGPLPSLQGNYCYKIYHARSEVCPDCVPYKALKTGLISTGILKRKSKKDGTLRFLQSVAVPFLDSEGVPQTAIEILFDVTKSKLLEMNLQRSEEFYRTLFEYSGTAITVNDKEGILTSVNRRFCDLTGYSREEIEGKKNYIDFVEDKERVRKIHENRWAKRGMSPTKYEYTLLRKNGEKRLVELTTNRIPGTNYQIASMIDLTEKKELEKEVREKEQFLADILRESADAIIAIDHDRTIRTWNRGAELIFGYKPEEIIGQSFAMMVPQDLLEEGELDKLRAKVLKHGYVRNYITERLNKNKKRVHVAETVTLITDENKNPIGRAIILRDITETKRLEQQLVQNEKMRAIGTLSASLAHEIKNPLNSIVINMEILKNHIEGAGNTSLSKYTEIIGHEIARLDKVIKDFLNYAKPQSTKYKNVNINEVIMAVTDLLDNESKKSNIELIKRLAKDILDIHGEENQLRQIMLNLLLNAIQAMPKGGRLTVETKNMPDGSVRVTIADTGSGIRKEVQSEIFNPFFTTRKDGSGLGLSMVSQLVKNHGGDIKFESEEGVGTTFYISFPSN